MILQQSGNIDVVSQTIGAVECRMLCAVKCRLTGYRNTILQKLGNMDVVSISSLKNIDF